jgi:hypothetical protein
MNSQREFFKTLKKHRGWYITEYSCPIRNSPLACLQLTILERNGNAEIAAAMESEALDWFSQYPVPVEVSAWDDVDRAIRLDSIRESDFLTAYVPKGKDQPLLTWQKIAWADLPQEGLDCEYLKSIYKDVKFKTRTEIDREFKYNNRIVFAIWWFFFFWAVVIPTTVLIIGETNLVISIGQHKIYLSSWVKGIALLLSIWKIAVKILKLTGVLKKSQKEKEEEEMRHHHYHCKKNPEAFILLRNENLEREAREHTQKEAESLKQPSLQLPIAKPSESIG